jgi:hypothetical protein
VKIRINRAPVLTLWAAVVAEELGYPRSTALTLGKAIAGKGAVNKAKAIGLMKEQDEEDREERARARDAASDGAVFFMGKSVRVIKTKDGLAAEENGRPTSHETVEKYLTKKFGENLAPLRAAMVKLARSRKKKALAREAFRLYETFRPEIPKGAQGWGKAGVLDTEAIKKLSLPPAKRGKPSTS